MMPSAYFAGLADPRRRLVAEGFAPVPFTTQHEIVRPEAMRRSFGGSAVGQPHRR
ncbi:hypothetical protein [Microbacterium sp. UFMG61]|uniref:hypothetical protein n=1 Tax=Microbacterium sp. UFMG61 TaxID=2745935 RepID=UPI001890452D|nr:hypothetical protein [Microbacterium sp. UFMG61]